MKKRVILISSIALAALLIGGGVLTFVLINNAKQEKNPSKPQDFTISLNHTILQLKEGKTETLVATTSEAATVTWSSLDEEIATVSQEGLVTALKEGNTTVTASAKGKSASCTIEVSKDEQAFTIDLNETEINLKEGETFDLVATTSELATVTWSVVDDTIASVDQAGHVEALKEGTTFVVASANGVSKDCKVVVTKEVVPVDTPINLSWGTSTLGDIDDLGNGEEKGPYQINLVTTSNSSESYTGRFSVELTSTSNNQYKLIDYLFIRVYNSSVKNNPLIDINSSTNKSGYTDVTMTGNETKTLYVYIGMDEVAPYIFDELKNDFVNIVFDWSPLP